MGLPDQFLLQVSAGKAGKSKNQVVGRLKAATRRIVNASIKFTKVIVVLSLLLLLAKRRLDLILDQGTFFVLRQVIRYRNSYFRHFKF